MSIRRRSDIGSFPVRSAGLLAGIVAASILASPSVHGQEIRAGDVTSSDGVRIHDFERVILQGESHGSSHFNPRYAEALVDFIRENDPSSP